MVAVADIWVLAWNGVFFCWLRVAVLSIASKICWQHSMIILVIVAFGLVSRKGSMSASSARANGIRLDVFRNQAGNVVEGIRVAVWCNG